MLMGIETYAGAGHQIFTCDVPVPVWAGNGSVTRSHQSDISSFSTHNSTIINGW